VKDPQRTYKDLIAEAGLSSTVTRVIGVSKLAKKYKSFEQRRQLEGSHDIFLADDRVVLKLPKILGKTFLKKTSKIPIPVAITGKEKDEAKKAGPLKAEIEKALSSTYLYPSPAPSSNVRVALSTFTPEQVVDNVEQAIKVLTEKKIVKGWRGVRSLHIKTSESAALPIWMAPTLYEEEDILQPEEEKRKALARAEKVAERREQKMKRKKRKSVSEGASANEVEVDVEKAAKRQKVDE
jgi:ribosome biogenesis protein UTP30